MCKVPFDKDHSLFCLVTGLLVGLFVMKCVDDE